MSELRRVFGLDVHVDERMPDDCIAIVGAKPRGTYANPRSYPCSHQRTYGCAICDRRRRPEPTFRLIDQATGRYLEPWQLRAGMKVVETTYYHDSRTVVAVVVQVEEQAGE